MGVIHGDLFDVLPTLDAESIDACVTDPPYGLEFMGKEWDRLTGDAWRVGAGFSKPGIGERTTAWPSFGAGDTANATCALCGGRMRGAKRCNCAEPDWRVKGRSISESTSDSRQAQSRKMQEWHEAWAREVYRVLKPGAYLMAFGGTRTFHRLTSGVEDAGFEIRDCLSWLYGQGFPKSLNFDDGWGTALKPSWEPIILARKSTNGTVKANRDEHGTGAINIDACRNGDEERTYDLTMVAGGFETTGGGRNVKSGEKTVTGRWPANVVLDVDAATLLDEQSGELVSGANPERRGSDKFRGIYSDFKGQESCDAARGQDIGGASRFFYVAKPSREERDLGCDLIEPRQRDESRKDGNPGGDNPRNRGLQRRGNFHPTVKPLALMRWLVRLVTPVGGTVLDPFGGSGTTAMACAAEGFNFVLIEREAEYVPIIEARVRSIAPLFTETGNG